MIRDMGRLPMLTRPLFGYGAAFAGGIALGGTGLFSVYAALIILAAALVLAFVWRNQGFAAPLLIFLALGLLMQTGGWREPPPFPAHAGDTIIIEGLALANAQPRQEEGFSLPLRPSLIEGQPYEGGDLLIYGEGAGGYQYGDTLQIRGTVLSLTGYGNPQAFDYAAYLQRQGFSAAVSTAYTGEIILMKQGGGNILRLLSAKIRLRLDQALETIPLKHAEYIKGVFLGEKSGLSVYEKRILAETGILHAFAVSGLHVGYIAALAALLLGQHYKRRWPRLLLGLALLLFYLFLVGFRASVLRATIMASLVLLAPVFHEKSDLLNSWGLAVLLVLSWRPALLFDAGFQLSFGTVLAIGLLQPVFSRLLPRKGWLKDSFAITFAASLGSMPLVAWYFHLASFAGWLLSPVLLLLIGLVVVLGMAATLTAIFSLTLASWLLISAGFLMEIVYTVAEWAAGFRLSWMALMRPGIGILILYFMLLAALPWVFRRWGKIRTYLAIAAMMALMLLPLGSKTGAYLTGLEPEAGLLEVVFLDVGQGDCAVVFTPKGQTIVIDGGGTVQDLYWAGDYILAPYLQSRGLSRIGLVINSHPHEDHIGGLFSVLRLFQTDTALLSAACGEIPLQQQFAEEAQAANCRIILAQGGESYLLEEDLSLEILSPPKGAVYSAVTANEGSLLMQLRYKELAILFTGDLEGANLTRAAGMSEVKADILKLPHHGSIHSMNEDFYRRVNPQAVVVSAGQNNPFGHPSPVISDYWQEQGIPFYRTDKHGAITLVSDGLAFELRSVYQWEPKYETIPKQYEAGFIFPRLSLLRG